MLRRLAVDNYRCFVNFELKLDQFHLLMGANGTGKSSVGHLLQSLRDLAVNNHLVRDHFANTRHKGVKGEMQSFELELVLEGKAYLYQLNISHSPLGKTEIFKEALFVDQQLDLLVAAGGLQLEYGGAIIPYGTDRSAIPLAAGRPNTRRFYDWLKASQYLRFLPGFGVDTYLSDSRLSEDVANFVPWMRFVLQNAPAIYVRLRDLLRESVEGFQDLGAREDGNTGTHPLSVDFESEQGGYSIPFSQLSDGQRMLIALYATLIYFTKRPGLVIFDEPDNFVGLRELQPWLNTLEEALEQSPAQVMIVSHHPEYLNQLADRAIVFKRRPSGWVHAEALKRDSAPALPLAELVARGWESE